MLANNETITIRSTVAVLICLVLEILCPAQRLLAINITVDYRYDTNHFFDTAQKKAPLEAAAARYSAIITTSLSAVTLADNSTDPRIGFNHPGTGALFQVSSAVSQATDALVASSGVANDYRGPWSIAANQWILYAGGSTMSSTGFGGTGTGSN